MLNPKTLDHFSKTVRGYISSIVLLDLFLELSNHLIGVSKLLGIPALLDVRSVTSDCSDAISDW